MEAISGGEIYMRRILHYYALFLAYLLLICFFIPCVASVSHSI